MKLAPTPVASGTKKPANDSTRTASGATWAASRRLTPRCSGASPRSENAGLWIEEGPMKVRILVRPKSGILDPQGEAVRRALPALGFEGVKTVHIGRLVEMEVESANEVEGMCRRLLANPTTEEYEWEVLS